MDIKIDYKVRQLNNILCEIDSIYQMLLQNKSISDSEYAIIFAILGLGEGCLQKEIAEISYISKKTINTTIKKFERDGIIELKAGKYPNMHIYLTDNGKKYIQEHIIPIIEIENKFMENIPDDEFEKFSGLYEKYMSKFKNYLGNIK